MDILQKLSSSYHGHGAEGSEQRGSHVEDGHWHALKDSDSIECCDLQNANWVCTDSPPPHKTSQPVGITVCWHYGFPLFIFIYMALQYQKTSFKAWLLTSKSNSFYNIRKVKTFAVSVINVQTIALFNRDMMSNCFTPHEFKNVLNLENPPLLHPNLATIPFLNRRIYVLVNKLWRDYCATAIWKKTFWVNLNFSLRKSYNCESRKENRIMLKHLWCRCIRQFFCLLIKKKLL